MVKELSIAYRLFCLGKFPIESLFSELEKNDHGNTFIITQEYNIEENSLYYDF